MTVKSSQNISSRRLPFPASLWHATASASDLAGTLQTAIQTDVLVVGAGFTGLSAALHLAEQGVDVCLIDAAQPGWGASGRNGGQVIPGLKYDPDELIARFGPERGERLIDFAGSAADRVFDLIARHNIDCQAVRKGWIQTAHNHSMLDIIKYRAAQWAARGAPVQLLDSAQVAQRLGTTGFKGGWIDHRAGCIQPLSYARGLLQACRRLGVQVYGDTAAVKLTRQGQAWLVHTNTQASVRARRVLIATNGYTDALA